MDSDKLLKWIELYSQKMPDEIILEPYKCSNYVNTPYFPNVNTNYITELLEITNIRPYNMNYLFISTAYNFNHPIFVNCNLKMETELNIFKKTLLKYSNYVWFIPEIHCSLPFTVRLFNMNLNNKRILLLYNKDKDNFTDFMICEEYYCRNYHYNVSYSQPMLSLDCNHTLYMYVENILTKKKDYEIDDKIQPVKDKIKFFNMQFF